jgi:hypothetical protein
VERIGVQLHARHPVAAVQYARMLAAHRDLRVVPRDERALIAILDGERPWIEDTLSSLLSHFPATRPIVLSASAGEEECRDAIRMGVWGLVTYDR